MFLRPCFGCDGPGLIIYALVVYDVSNRETFEALPRWYSELETYVSESVVKIIVGNKVDKVRLFIIIIARRMVVSRTL